MSEILSIWRFLSGFFSNTFGDSNGAARSAGDACTAVLDGRPDEQDDWADSELTGWWIPDEPAVIAPPPETQVHLIDRVLYDQLAQVLNDPDLELPRLPQIAQRALLMLHNPDVDFGRLAELLGQDPATAARVLQVTNSVAYRGMCEVSRLDLACARLGVRELRSIVLVISTRGLLIQNGQGQFSRGGQLWRRALASSVVLAQFCDPKRMSVDEAFMLGLLHDIGMLAILKVLHEYEQAGGRKVPDQLFKRLCDEWHEHIGLRMADTWNLPAPLPEIIGNHHREQSEDDSLDYQRALVQFGDVVCSLLNYAPYVPYNLFALPCVEHLGLKNDRETCARLAKLPNEISRRIETG